MVLLEYIKYVGSSKPICFSSWPKKIKEQRIIHNFFGGIKPYLSRVLLLESVWGCYRSWSFSFWDFCWNITLPDYFFDYRPNFRGFWKKEGKSGSYSWDFCFLLFFGHCLHSLRCAGNNLVSSIQYHVYRGIWEYYCSSFCFYDGLSFGPICWYSNLSFLEKPNEREIPLAAKQLLHLFFPVNRYVYRSLAFMCIWWNSMGAILRARGKWFFIQSFHCVFRYPFVVSVGVRAPQKI